MAGLLIFPKPQSKHTFGGACKNVTGVEQLFKLEPHPAKSFPANANQAKPATAENRSKRKLSPLCLADVRPLHLRRR